MATVDLNSENFVSTIKENDLVLIDFWADWCGPCKRFSPVYSKVSEKHDDIIFGKLDTEANQEIAGSLGIMSIPTVMAFHKGDLVYNQAGMMTPPQLENLIEKLRDLPAEAQ